MHPKTPLTRRLMMLLYFTPKEDNGALSAASSVTKQYFSSLTRILLAAWEPREQLPAPDPLCKIAALRALLGIPL